MAQEAKEEEKQTTTEKLLIHLRRINKSRLQKLALQYKPNGYVDAG